MKMILLMISIWLMAVPAMLSGAQRSDVWSDKEIGEDGDAEGTQIQLPLRSDSNCSGESPCDFKLTYFLGDGFDLNRKTRKNILYIPGGPGALVDSENRFASLRLLEKNHNVVYFHPRGMAQSRVDPHKSYDRFLRAGYVVEDIEKLRQAVLQSRPWDVIYAHSWGTVIAQRYAAKYGKPNDAAPKVLSLILTGPVDRHRETHGARTRMTIENLKAIYRDYRSQAGAQCRCQSTAHLRPLVTDLANPQISTFGGSLDSSDNFCFLKPEVGDQIVARLEKMITIIDENFGSADFVVDHFNTLKNDKTFQKRFSDYPVEFFAAIRYLQMSGAPEKDGLVFAADSRQRISAAFLIAHYLTAEKPRRCGKQDVLAKAAAPECEYCERFRAAREEVRARMANRESQRGNYVYGVYDGVARWISVSMGENGCFSGRDMAKFTAQSDQDKNFIRAQVEKIGVVAEEKICPWDPEGYRHEVPTLLIKGSRDTVVAGCQAEDFYINGTQKGRSILLEFRGLGHDLSVGNLYFGADPSIWSKRFTGVLEDFMRMSSSPAKFRSDARVKEKLVRLKADDRSETKTTAACGKSS